MELTPGDARQIVNSDHPEWEEVAGSLKLIGQRRWATETTAVFCHKPTGKTYQLNWDAPSTEMQDMETTDMFGHETFVICEVAEKEVVVKQWVTIP